MPSAVKKYRRESSEISCCLKYVMFSFNVVFWMCGLVILGIGIWAWSEKDIFNNLTKFTFIALDPAFLLIIIGSCTFIISFTGSIGALRENTCLLGTYAILLIILLITEISLGTLAFILKDKGWIKDQATEGLRAFIIHYREDPDQQNLIDWIQEDWLQCCGIDGPKDWDSNNYFNCSSGSVGSREACGVPFSCCKPRAMEIIKNKQCGYDVRKEGYVVNPNSNINLMAQPADRHIYERGCLRAGEDWLENHLIGVGGTCLSIMITEDGDVSKIIYEKGCVQAGEEWIERNLIIISTISIFLIFFQILGICFSQNLRADIQAQKSKWH